MIYIAKEQAGQVRYLIDQAIQGNHILFDREILRSALGSACSPQSESTEEEYAVEPHIEKLMSLKGLDEKRAYLDRLDRRTLECVVRTYFNIIENTLYESHGVTH